MEPRKIICDTRQKSGKHKHVDGWFSAHGVPYEYRKLDFGDYMTEMSNISIDTKKDLTEVAGNIGRDHKRFARELDRARASGYRLVLLVEAGHGYRTVDDVERWVAQPCRRCTYREAHICDPATAHGCRRYRCKPMQGPQVSRIMRTMALDHGCRWEFCDKRVTGKRICELLGVKYD